MQQTKRTEESVIVSFRETTTGQHLSFSHRQQHTRDETFRLDDAQSTFIGIFMAADSTRGTNFYRSVVFAAPSMPGSGFDLFGGNRDIYS